MSHALVAGEIAIRQGHLWWEILQQLRHPFVQFLHILLLISSAARLKELRLVLNSQPRIAQAEIAKHVEKITLTPEGRTYIASGTWNVLGAENHGWCRGPELYVTATA